jgi:hypothetical protein
MLNTVYKEDKDTAQIIHVQKIVDFVYYQCYREHQAATTMKRRGLKIKAKLAANIWASMSKKILQKIMSGISTTLYCPFETAFFS